jgi:hypothetical protein
VYGRVTRQRHIHDQYSDTSREAEPIEHLVLHDGTHGGRRVAAHGECGANEGLGEDAARYDR